MLSIMVFSIREKLGGLFPTMEKRVKELNCHVADGQSFQRLRATREWPAMETLLTKIHNDAVRELGTRGLSVEATRRLNHRLELLREVEDHMVATMKRGHAAQDRLTKIKEKEERDARRRNPTN